MHSIRMMATSVDVDFCWCWLLSRTGSPNSTVSVRELGNPSLRSLNLDFMTTTGLDLPILSICTRIKRSYFELFATGLDLPILQYPYKNWSIPLFELWTLELLNFATKSPNSSVSVRELGTHTPSICCALSRSAQTIPVLRCTQTIHTFPTIPVRHIGRFRSLLLRSRRSLHSKSRLPCELLSKYLMYVVTWKCVRQVKWTCSHGS